MQPDDTVANKEQQEKQRQSIELLDRQNRNEAVKANQRTNRQPQSMFITIMQGRPPLASCMYFVANDTDGIYLRNDQPKCKGKQALRDARGINAKSKSPNTFTGEVVPSESDDQVHSLS